MDEDVDAGQIERAKRRALRAANGRPGHRVDLFDRVLAGCDEREQMHHAREREMVADEVRRVLRNHHSLAEVVIGERADLVDDRAARVSGWNDFEQMQVTGRVEEVRAEPVTPEVVAATLGERVNRNA